MKQVTSKENSDIALNTIRRNNSYVQYTLDCLLLLSIAVYLQGVDYGV